MTQYYIHYKNNTYNTGYKSSEPITSKKELLSTIGKLLKDCNNEIKIDVISVNGIRKNENHR